MWAKTKVTLSVVLVSVAAVASTAQNASAAPIFGASVETRGGGFYLGFDLDSIPLTYGVDSLGISSAVSGQYGSALATASVDNGALRASASASGFDFGTPGLGMQAIGASAAAFFTDTFVPVSTSIAVGTLVDIDFDWALTYSMTGTGCEERSDVYAYITLSGFYINGGNAGGVVRQLQDSSCNPDFEVDRSQFQVRIGEEFRADIALQISAYGVPLTTTDAGNTLRLAVRPLGDFALQTASGNDYTPTDVPSVPEPTGLLYLGLAALLTRARRHFAHPHTAAND